MNILVKNHPVTKREIELLSMTLLVMAIFLGIAARWNFISHADFPINDGGFFYAMITDLIDNNFRLPVSVSYNLDQIPFSYPPLSFYIAGALHKLTGVALIELLHFLPWVISVLTIPAFYWVSRIFFPEELFFRSIATFLFATLPRSFEWFVMGGGITRSFGMLFALLAINFYARTLSQDKQRANLVFSILFSCLTVLSHPVAGLFLAFSLLIISIYFWPIKITTPLIVSGLVILLTSPWWVTVLRYNGLAPFLGASNTGHLDWFEIRYLITQNFDFENRFFLPWVSILAILGLFSSQKRKSLFLGLLVGLGYLFVPRGGVDLLTIYQALLGTLGFSLIVKRWALAGSSHDGEIHNLPVHEPKFRFLLIYLVIYTFVGAFSYKYIDGKGDLHLSNGEHTAMTWIQENTSESAKLMHLPASSNYQSWWNDYFGEWMPVFTERQNVVTVQGYEWLPGEFNQRIERYIVLRSCTYIGLSCVEDWLNIYDVEVDYLLLNIRQHPKVLIDNFLNSPDYREVYENSDVIIFKRDPGKNNG